MLVFELETGTGNSASSSAEMVKSQFVFAITTRGSLVVVVAALMVLLLMLVAVASSPAATFSRFSIFLKLCSPDLTEEGETGEQEPLFKYESLFIGLGLFTMGRVLGRDEDPDGEVSVAECGFGDVVSTVNGESTGSICMEFSKSAAGGESEVPF